MAKEQKTKSFVLRIDATTMEALEKWAADEFRSINGQLQWLIDDALRRSGRCPYLTNTGFSFFTCCRSMKNAAEHFTNLKNRKIPSLDIRYFIS